MSVFGTRPARPGAGTWVEGVGADAKVRCAEATLGTPRRRPARALSGLQAPASPRRPSVACIGGPSLVVRGSPRLLSTPPRKEPPGVGDLLHDCLRLSSGPAPEALRARQFVASWDGPPFKGPGRCFEASRQLLAGAALQLPGRCHVHVGEALAHALGGAGMPAHHRRGLAAALMAHVGLRVRVSAQEEGEASEREIEAARFATGVLRASCRDADDARSMALDMMNWAVAQQRRPATAHWTAASAGPPLRAKEAAAEPGHRALPRQPPELFLGRVGSLALAMGGRQIGPRALRDLLQVVSGLEKDAGQRAHDPFVRGDVALALGTLCAETGGRAMGELSCKVLVAHLCDPAAAADPELRAAMVYRAALELAVCEGEGEGFVRQLLQEATMPKRLSLVEVGGVAWALGLHLCGADPQRLGWHQPYAPLLAPGDAPMERVFAALGRHAQDLPDPQRERLFTALALVRTQLAPDAPDWTTQRQSASVTTSTVSPAATPSSALSSSAGLTPSPASRSSFSVFRLSTGSAPETKQDGFFGKLDPVSLIFDDSHGLSGVPEAGHRAGREHPAQAPDETSTSAGPPTI